ncbi:MICOS complex subunit MIC27 isoform X3 [Anomalospiza imberbis]|uniref:MICOS complex subunit MIC27 isoform X3 n=1 Tax=Anomalospiza imberbis TaxID=187417 RepID=UPI00358E1057
MQRLKAKIIQVAKLAAISSGLPFVCITVYAATEKESKSQLVKPDKLPIYSAPPLRSRYIEEQPGHLQQQLTALRSTTGRYFGWCQSVYVFIKNGIMDSIQFGKGSRFKKIAYPLGLTTVGYSVCYPAQSVVIAKVTGKKLLCASHQTYEAVRSLWADKETVTKLQQESKPIMQEDKKKKGISSTKPEPAVESRSLNRTESFPVECWSNEDPVPSSGAVKTSKFKPDPKLTDHGQSSPEDVDMYSTRS